MSDALHKKTTNNLHPKIESENCAFIGAVNSRTHIQPTLPVDESVQDFFVDDDTMTS